MIPRGFLAFLALSLSALSSFAQDSSIERITFLHLKISGDQVTLIRASIREGKLKKQPQNAGRGAIRFDVQTSDGKVLQTGSIPDPNLRRLEAGSTNGALTSVAAPVTDATLRLPYQANARKLRLYKVPEGSARSSSPKELGSIDLPH